MATTVLANDGRLVADELHVRTGSMPTLVRCESAKGELERAVEGEENTSAQRTSGRSATPRVYLTWHGLGAARARFEETRLLSTSEAQGVLMPKAPVYAPPEHDLSAARRRASTSLLVQFRDMLPSEELISHAQALWCEACSGLGADLSRRAQLSIGMTGKTRCEVRLTLNGGAPRRLVQVAHDEPLKAIELAFQELIPRLG